ncbi:MAG TPA: hypothetical protein VNK23_05955 [Candidatus Dormibacteraeota bacterium]|nr:hypothetical protein [Candidatus Dormibacteraeota bacterium]
MSRRNEIYVFAALLLVLVFVLYRAIRPAGVTVTGVYADNTKFHPLDVQEPQLHLNLLDNLRKIEYTGVHRNIFVAEPIPPPRAQQTRVERPAGPQAPPPPPPLEVPVKFFGYASEQHGGHRVGFFASGDDVLVLAQGDEFLSGRYRLLSISNTSAEVMEISSGRQATLPITQPPGQASN